MKRTNLMMIGLVLILAIGTGGICAAEESRYPAQCKPPVPDTWLQEQQRIQREKAPPNVPVPAVIDCRPQSCEVDLTEEIKVVCRTCSYTIYKCTSRDDNGSVLLTCRDAVVRDRPEITISEKEFKNKKTRCTKFCGSCPTGWK
jgi:hypothetical protein